MSDTTTISRGISSCPCPICNEEDTLAVQVHSGELYCSSCEFSLTAEELEMRARTYLKIALWMRLVPTFTFGEEPTP